MYLPVKLVQRVTPGLGYFSAIDPALQESEFYPPPYDTDNPLGLGDWTDSLTADSVITGLPNWALGAGALALVLLFKAGTSKRSARRKARAEYQSKLAKIDQDYSVKGLAKRAARRIPRVRVTTG